MTFRPGLFPSFFLGGFECSAHRRPDGRRLDLIAATGHDRLADADYRQLARHGLRGARDGVRWHLVEAAGPGRYDWAPVQPLLAAAAAHGVRVIWDLCHYGWPDWLDIWSPDFVARFADYAAAFAALAQAETGAPPWLCPMNEISYIAWAGGSVAHINPFAEGRGNELKAQVVRATLAATRAVRGVAPAAHFLAAEPRIRIVARPDREAEDAQDVAMLNAGQWEAWDMLAGRLAPELGGADDMLDLLGVNFYWNNQWWHHGSYGMPLSVFDERWRPLHLLLADVHGRYRRPLLIAETSCEGDRRAPWLRYVAEEARAALAAGVPLEGICLYPVLSHPGWDNDRYCPNGLFEMECRDGQRPVDAPLAAELRRQQAAFAADLAAPGASSPAAA